MPSQRSEMCAEERTMPSRTMPGTPTPTCRSSSGVSSSTISAITSAMSSGSPPTGFATVMRSVSRIPVVTSTIPALSVVPPMSMPRASRSRRRRASAAPSGAATTARSPGMNPPVARPLSEAGRGAVSGWGTAGPLGCGSRLAGCGAPVARVRGGRARIGRTRPADPGPSAAGPPRLRTPGSRRRSRRPRPRRTRPRARRPRRPPQRPDGGGDSSRVEPRPARRGRHRGPRPSIRPGTHRVGWPGWRERLPCPRTS